MKQQTQFRRVISSIGLFLIVAVVTYGFLALCNWNILPKDWNGFSRFILAGVGVVFLVKILDDLNIL